MGDDAGLAGAGRTGGEYVIARVGDLDAELDGPRRALLANDPLQIGRVGGGNEAELGRVAAAAQTVGGELRNRGHLGSP